MRTEKTSEVIVMGGGLAGMTASLLLRRLGHEVTCIGPTAAHEYSLGESLDFIAPRLLLNLGFDVDAMVRANEATYKKLVKIEADSGEDFVLRPLDAFKSIFGLETRTIHLDRGRFDESLRKAAVEAGVEHVDATVSRLRSNGDTISACVADSGEYRAQWFLDATSRSRLVARHFDIASIDYGVQKVAIWSHLEAVPGLAGTTFHMTNRFPDLEWIWEIPITRKLVSVGLVLSAERLKQARRTGEAIGTFLARKLNAFERFSEVHPEAFRTPVRACSYRNSVIERVAGKNWMVMGEAASMVDPMTSSGASAAIRHAVMASEIVHDALRRGRADEQLLRNYGRCVVLPGRAFNRNIERTIYAPSLRKNINFYWAALAYTIFGYFFNAISHRQDFRSERDVRRLRWAAGGFTAWLSFWHLLGRFFGLMRFIARIDR